MSKLKFPFSNVGSFKNPIQNNMMKGVIILQKTNRK